MDVPEKLIEAISAKVEVEIGDTKQIEFYPQLKTMLWNNECNFSLRLSDDSPAEKAVVETRAGGASWDKQKVRVNFIAGEDSYDFDVILKERPATNILTFTIQTKGLEFHYQPHEVEEGGERPDNVKGSYAVYHSTKQNNKYMTGKAFHFYRPAIIDATGKEAWCEMQIDTAAQLLHIYLPAKFLETAAYPVVVR